MTEETDHTDHREEDEEETLEVEAAGDVNDEEEEEEAGEPTGDPEQDKIKPVIYISLVLTSLFALGESL